MGNGDTYLRKIKETRWLSDPPWIDAPGSYSDPSWMTGGEVLADTVLDLLSPVDRGAISLFRVNSNDLASIRRVGAALMAGAQSIDKFEYCLISTEIISSLGLRLEETLGTTADELVNATHVDLVNLTGSLAVRLTSELKRGAAIRSFFPKREMRKELQQALSAKRLDRSRVSEKILGLLGT